jgi:succinate dehydrogenase/fumarate reductase flavoprotein subunit
MGCHTCGRRQVDPVTGPSTWRRAVVAGEQVLLCPDCQGEGWTDGLDRCRACASTVLVKRLGEISCRSCGATGEAAGGGAAPTATPAPSAAREALADDVAAALDRVLRGEA